MPITPAFTWSETEDVLEVLVKLPGASRSRSDVFATDCLVKVNCAPYLLVLDLHGEVDGPRTVATFTANEAVRFTLHKRTPGTWGQLQSTLPKDQLLHRRTASIDAAHEAEQRARAARLQRKQHEERAAVDRQIELERRKRQEIEARKQAELAAERDGLAAWQRQVAGRSGVCAAAPSAPAPAAGGGDESDYETDGEDAPDASRAGGGATANDSGEGNMRLMADHPHYHGKGWWPSAQDPNQRQHRPATQDDDSDAEAGAAQASELEPSVGRGGTLVTAQVGHVAASGRASREEEPGWRPLPPPRLRADAVKVQFTQLEMPHLPAREAREEELRVYKRTQARVKDDALAADSADIADRQPLFLRDKGAALFAQGNYMGAVGAFTRAIDLDATIPLLWSNRAAAWTKLGEHGRAVDDCTAAINLLRPRLPRYEEGSMEAEDAAAFKRQLVRVLARRGAALAACGRLPEALADCEEAARYDRDDASLAQDVEELKAAMAPSLGPDALRERATARFAARDFAGAAEAYSLLLALPDVTANDRATALSNRAAAALGAGHPGGAVRDCCAAMALVLQQLTGACGPEPVAAVTNADETPDTGCDSQPGWDQRQAGDSPGNDSPLSPVSLEQLRALQAQSSAAWGTLPDLERDALHEQSAPAAPLLEVVDSEASHAASTALHAWLVERALSRQLKPGLPKAAARQLASLARLLARRAAACGHLRRYAAAKQDFEAGAAAFRLCGCDDKAAALEVDARRMAGMASGSDGEAGGAWLDVA